MNPQTKHIEVVPYNPNWPKLFEQAASEIKKILSKHCLEIHHIGSTSVPGLCAKIDIDVLCVVDELDSSLVLKDFNYIFKGEANVPLRYYFSKNSDDLRVNLHVVESDNGFINLNLCFRDCLRDHDDVRLEYTDLKQRILKDPESYRVTDAKFTVYNLRKNLFIKSILEKAGFDAFCINFCMHDKEWEEYNRIREEQIFKPNDIVYDKNHSAFIASNHYHFVLYKGVKIVGAAHIELSSDSEAVWRTVAIDGPCKGQGCGSYLVRFLEKWIMHKGRKIIKLHANIKAEQFYRKLGYVEMFFEDDKGVQKICVDMGKEL